MIAVDKMDSTEVHFRGSETSLDKSGSCCREIKYSCKQDGGRWRTERQV